MIKKIILLIPMINLVSSTFLTYNNKNKDELFSQNTKIKNNFIPPIWKNTLHAGPNPDDVWFYNNNYTFSYGQLGYNNLESFFSSNELITLNIGFESSVGSADKWKNYYLEFNSSKRASFFKQFVAKPIEISDIYWKVPHIAASKAEIFLQLLDVPKERKLLFKCSSDLANSNAIENVFTEMFYV